MRNTLIVISVLALTAAAPGAAQSTENTLNAAATEPAENNNAAGTENMIVTTDSGMAGSANDLTAAPAAMDQPVDTAEADPAPAKKRSFPWGAVGLLGLLGLMGRKGR